MFTNIPSANLRQLVKLSQRKEKLMAQIQAIDREMVRLESKHGVPTRAALQARVTVSGSPGPAKARRPKGNASRKTR